MNFQPQKLPDEAVILLLRGQILFLCQAVKMFISAVKFTVESTGTDSLLEARTGGH